MSKRESVTEMTVRLAGKQTDKPKKYLPSLNAIHPAKKDADGNDINKKTLYAFYRQGGHRHEERVLRIKRNGFCEMDGPEHYWVEPKELKPVSVFKKASELAFNKAEAIQTLSELKGKANGDGYVTIHRLILEKIIEALIAG